MSPASKSKSKDKSISMVAKEQSKISMKPSTVHPNCGNGSPVMRTFHTHELSHPSAPQINSQFITFDDSDDHSWTSPSATTEYDSSSNNGSCSGESEDPKEKPTTTPPQTETIFCSESDKKGKVRQKNERKHQRQKERRAQELHERCIAFLTSRKLESLSHQLVSMGFPVDRATMAIIANEGRMEESVAWLLHDDEPQVLVNLHDKSCAKIDITDELARIEKMEAKHKYSRQDVERAIVACEGDLVKAEETLKVQKQAVSVSVMSKSDEFSFSTEINDKAASPNKSPLLIRSPMKGSPAIKPQQRLGERDFNPLKTVASGILSQDSANRKIPKRLLPKPSDWPRTPVSLASQVQVSVPPTNLDGHFVAMTNHELKANFSVVKEPVVVMQRPKQKLPPSSISPSASPPTSAGWYSSADSDMSHKLAKMGRNGSALPSVEWSACSWNVSGTSSSLVIPSSLGLFTGRSSESSIQNDWSAWSITPHLDYTSIDWSLDLTPRRPCMKIDCVSDTWSTMFMGGNSLRNSAHKAAGDSYFPGIQRVSGLFSDSSASAIPQEWTSPFQGRDLFRVSRQYVTSPSM